MTKRQGWQGLGGSGGLRGLRGLRGTQGAQGAWGAADHRRQTDSVSRMYRSTTPDNSCKPRKRFSVPIRQLTFIFVVFVIVIVIAFGSFNPTIHYSLDLIIRLVYFQLTKRRSTIIFSARSRLYLGSCSVYAVLLPLIITYRSRSADVIFSLQHCELTNV